MHALAGLERWFGWLLQTSWQAAVLALLILLAQFLMRNRLSPGWRHGLWLLLLIRLLMPMMPSSAVSIFNLTKAPRPRATTPTPAPLSPSIVSHLSFPTAAAVPPSHPVKSEPAMKLRSEVLPPLISAPNAPITPASGTVSRPAKKGFDWLAVAAATWMVGALALALRFIWSNIRFARQLRPYAPVQDASFGSLYRACAHSLGITQHVVVVDTDLVESPAVYGLWPKRLLLPEGLREELTPDELRHVLQHELAHIRRRDPELNFLATALQLLHWFNPVLWFAFARMRADRELATDELALAHTQSLERRAYGETLLKVLAALSVRPALPGLVGIGESKAQIGERIRAIARGSIGTGWRWAAGMLAAILAGAALTSAREDKTKGIDLLKKYPTTLVAGDPAPDRARPWQFTENDIYQVSRFAFELDDRLRVQAGPSDLGIGHCSDGAVWAVLLPRQEGKLTSSAAGGEEKIVLVWLRFHPSLINRLFPAETVSAAGPTSPEERIRAIAEAKFTSSWHAGQNAMIPEPKDLTVDTDTKGGPRRFFSVDTEAKTAEYVAAFADRPVKPASEAASEAEVDANCASVVSVAPPNGAQDVDPLQELRIRFDRPMNPYHLKLEWLAGGFQLNGSIQVVSDRTEFTIPVRLTPGQEQTVALNRDPQREMWTRMGKKGKAEPSPFAQGGFKDVKGAAAAEFRWSFTTKDLPANPDAPKPRVLSVSPPSGAATPVLAFVELTFDRPMRPPDYRFPYLPKRQFALEGPNLVPSFEYDAAAHRFTIPAVLRPDDDVRLTLKGFFSADGVPAEPVVLHYQAGTENFDPKYEARAKAAASDAKLQKLLTLMKEARTRLNSGIETVQTIQLGINKDAFSSIEAKTATFKWEGSDKAYADISGPMMTPGVFILGSDGANSWLYSENEKGEKRLDQTPVAVTEQDVSLADPFDLARRSVEEVLAGEGLTLASDAALEGGLCYRLEKWEVNQQHFVSASQVQWWIDKETLLPKQMSSFSGNWCQLVRFDYQNLNQPLPGNAFQPPAAPGGDAQPLFFAKEPAPGERRFLRINDGCGGRMSGRLGWHGPGGTTSSGLN